MNFALSFDKLALILVLLAPALETSPSPQRARGRGRNNNKDVDESSNDMGDLECVVDIGPLKRTMHQVKGRVCAVDLNTILIENFSFDGLGAGVFINIATKGKNRREWIQAREIIPYPDAVSARPIERRYQRETLVVKLPVDVTEVKWLSVWCEVFGISFGEVKFPKIVAE